ncbi:MAG: hypothetical protein H6702_01355 [Myxococcales bacterium]|nr:hypothetical protein [Myxococcales bacterium]
MSRLAPHGLRPVLLPALAGCLAWGCVAGETPAGLDHAAVADGGRPDVAPAVDLGAVDRAPPDADLTCQDDRYGPSTPELPAADLSVGHYALVACPGVPDHFLLVGSPGSTLRVRFEADERLAVQVGGERLEGRGGSVAVTLGNGGIPLQISGALAATGYGLDVTEDVPQADCGDDVESADVDGGAGLADGEAVARGICAVPDVDWLRFGGPAQWTVRLLEGAPLWLDLLGGPADAPLRHDGRYLIEGQAVLEASEAARLRIASGGHARYLVQVNALPERAQAFVERAVEVPFRSSPDAAPEWWPAAHLQVVADPAAGGGGMATRLDAAGRGPLVEGDTWLVAEAWAGRYRVTVGPGTEDDRGWREPLWLSEDGVLRLDPDGRVAPAFAIATAAATALAAGLAWVPDLADDPPPLHITWRPDAAAPCGSCFHPSDHGRPRVDLSGSPTDPDQGDLAVIRHEVGHHLAALHSRDTSPGGRHDGRAVDPELAWSEGFAHFFAAWVAGRSLLEDWRLTGSRLVDLEAPTHPDAQSPWAPPGVLSDHLVAGLLWDLFDDTPAEDPLHVDEAALFAPLFGSMASGVEGGATAGADLLDYLEGLACEPAGLPTGLGRWLVVDAIPECRE